MSRKPIEFENHPATYDYARSIGCFRAFCKYVTDGDTYDAYVDLGMGKYAYDTIRLQGLDTAEIFHPSNAAERMHGMAAKTRVIELLNQKPILLKTYRDAETFGRYVAEVWYFEQSLETSLADTLRAEGFAKKASY
jgi:endonuclease YncB( thermonuclease family)